MAAIVVPGAYMVSINAESGGQTVSNVIGVRGISNQAAQIAVAVSVAWNRAGGPREYHPTAYTMRNVTVMDLATETGQVVVWPSTGTGGAPGSLATNASCALVSYSSGSRSRSTRGRLYHGPLTESQMDVNGRHITVQFNGQLNTAYRQFKADLETAGYSWIVISRKNQTFVEIGEPTAQSLSGTQRRRLR